VSLNLSITKLTESNIRLIANRRSNWSMKYLFLSIAPNGLKMVSKKVCLTVMMIKKNDNLAQNHHWQKNCYIMSIMKIKNPFKNSSTMNTENTTIENETDDTITNGVSENILTAETEAHAIAEEVPAVELSVEEQLTQDLAAEKDKYIRLFAEFENYKRRTSKERMELYKTANQEVLQAMLPVMDDFDRAIVEISKSEDEVLLQGVTLIYEKLKSTLVGKGLEEVAIKAGDIFDADFAEAITSIPAPSPNFKGKIVDVIEKGYKLGDKIIRFPKVVTGS
jgi:molecular chaperone GrpE